MGGREDYAYLPLEDAMKAVGQKVNLFAAVYEIGVPWRSRGTDHVLSLKIVDPSYQTPGLSVNFFAEQPSKLPHVKSCGDIICLHRVTIGLHNGDVYCAFHKRFSSFALFEGKTGQSVIAYESSANYHGMPQDDEFIRRLRIWVVKQDSGVDAYTVELRGIKVGQSFDLICKVNGCSLCGMEQMLHLLAFKGMTDYVDVLDATLMDSLTHAEVTHKLKCIVRVVAAYPWRIENLRSPANGHYRVRLTLEDPTARIHAYLCEEDGVKFFCGYPPAAELAIKWNRLLGISDNDRITEDNSARRDPPWVWCCLKSFYADKNDPWGSRMYRVYATKLLG